MQLEPQERPDAPSDWAEWLNSSDAQFGSEPRSVSGQRGMMIVGLLIVKLQLVAPAA